MVKRFGIGDDEVVPTRAEVMGVFGGYAYLGIWLGAEIADKLAPFDCSCHPARAIERSGVSR